MTCNMNGNPKHHVIMPITVNKKNGYMHLFNFYNDIFDTNLKYL